MNGARTIFRRKGYFFTALAAAVLLAASSGTAWAQRSIKINSVSLSPTAVDEGGEATATVKFTVQAGPATTEAGVNDVPADPEVAVGFEFHIEGLGDSSPRATNAENRNFTGITNDPEQSQEFVSVAAIRAGNKRQYTATRTFRANHDLDAETGQFQLGATVTGWSDGQSDVAATPLAPAPGTYTIKDDETQTYTLTIPQGKKGAITEGDATATMVTLTADPGRSVAGTVPGFTLVTEPSQLFTFDRDTAFMQGGTTENGVTTGPAELAVAAGSAGASRDLPIGTIAADGDKNRVDDTVTLNLYIGGVGSASVVTSLTLVATDINKLAAPAAITAVAKDAALNGKEVTEIVEGGDPVYLTITVDRGTVGSADSTTGEDLTVNIRSNAAQSGDYEVDPVRVMLPGTEGGDSTTDVDIMLTALSDEDVGTEALVLNLEVSGVPANGSGSSTGTFTIPIVDKTTTKVAPKTEAEAEPALKAAMMAGAGEDGLNPGESFTVMTSDLFTVADGYTVAYGASVEGGAASVSASGDSITVDAKEAGEAKVTVTATAKMAASSFIPSQTVSNIAEIAFPVTVVDKPLVVTVAADPEEIMEGGTSTITATANRAVEAGDGAVEIGLEVVGDATVEPASITIAAGSMSGSAVLTAAEDDDYADGTVTVVATGSGIDAPRQVAIAVMDNDEEPVVVDPVPENTIWPRPEGEAYPVITGAIDGAAGDDGLNPGESFSVPAGDLFEVMDGYEASYSASVDNGDVASTSVSGDSVTVMADAAGEAKVTISGTSRMASSSFAPEQVDTNMADITFLVTVADKGLVVTVAADPAEIMEGGTSTITATANRAVTAGDGTVEIDLEVVGDATLDANSIMIAAGAMYGSVTLTATEDDNYEDETVTVVATGGGIDAARQLTIAVTDNDAAPEPPAALVVTLAMPANVMMGNIVEGESYEIVVSADRMVTEDTEVMIMRDRAASDADEDDFTVSSATIMAGYDSATAELMVTEDMVDDAGHADGEALVLFGMVDGEQTNSLTFTIWDTAVPALPLFGQMLLALFLMLGGARLYRRRQQG